MGVNRVRTSSLVVRLPLGPDGNLVEPLVAELVAEFEPWDPDRKRSADLMDMAFNSRGELFVACAREGRVWKVGIPDPARVFDGNDQRTPVDCAGGATPNRPFLDMPALTGKPSARVGNIAFDREDRLYLCSGNYDAGGQIAGVIYRAVTAPGRAPRDAARRSREGRAGCGRPPAPPRRPAERQVPSRGCR
ncbi:MAG: hypothetical protein AB1486_01430 [Planctomycetota bacterium]